MRLACYLFVLMAVTTTELCAAWIDGPYLATGIKIGEVDADSAIVWVRLTKRNKRIGEDAPKPEIWYKNKKSGKYEPPKGRERPDRKPKVFFAEGTSIESIEGATPGADGRARLRYREAGESDWHEVDWESVDPARDYTHQFKLRNLAAGAVYELEVEAGPLDKAAVTARVTGTFKTAPARESEAAVNFIVTTGTSYGDKETADGYRFYASALKLDPEFFVHTGDILYYDRLAKTKALAHWHWDRMYSLPNHVDFHRQVASYFIKDDHDTWMNDCYPGQETKYMGEFTYEQGTEIFLYEVPMGKKTYRTVRWGKDLQVWMVEGRDYRSSNRMDDGPDKTIWGKEQMEWFMSTVRNSDATFRVLISPTPIVGPDRDGKKDNHSNRNFAYEGTRVREFIQSQKNMVVVCGDRHWQYVSRDDETGVLEFSCGPGSNGHAGGWGKEDVRPEHLYLNVCGGFLEGEVRHKDGEPTLTFRHYTPKGDLLNEHVLSVE